MKPAPKATARGRSALARATAAAAALTPPAATNGSILGSLWPFPSVIFSAFLIAWGAECAQFWVSRGLALAVLAWLQALPEFAVEAVIAWSGQVHFMTANFTGSLRLLVGLGWPLIFAVAAWGTWRRERRLLRHIDLDPENSVEVLALCLPILYFTFIWWKSTLTLVDAGILLGMYVLYLWVLRKVPPRDLEHVEDLDAIPRRIMSLPRRTQGFTILALFVVGGLILFFSAEPFLHAMLGWAVSLGVSQYLFIQWVAPFLSEFPEKVSAMYWARQKGKSAMALMNMVSANINQWTMLAAMIPMVYSMSLGEFTHVPFDHEQRKEILLTIAQSLLGMLLLSNMSFNLLEACGIFLLWGAQFVRPDLHVPVTIAYFAWSALEILLTLFVRRRVAAFGHFLALWRQHGKRSPRVS